MRGEYSPKRSEERLSKIVLVNSEDLKEIFSFSSSGRSGTCDSMCSGGSSCGHSCGRCGDCSCACGSCDNYTSHYSLENFCYS